MILSHFNEYDLNSTIERMLLVEERGVRDFIVCV